MCEKLSWLLWIRKTFDQIWSKSIALYPIVGSRYAPTSVPKYGAHCLQGSEREYIIVSFVRSTSEDEDVVTSVAKTAGDSVALQELGGCASLESTAESGTGDVGWWLMHGSKPLVPYIRGINIHLLYQIYHLVLCSSGYQGFDS